MKLNLVVLAKQGIVESEDWVQDFQMQKQIVVALNVMHRWDTEATVCR